MNDVTSGVIYLADTNSAQMQVSLTVENIDSVPHNVTAGRLVISAPPASSNAFAWGQIQYVPTIDSSAVPETIVPSGSVAFEGFYFPNNTGGPASINYCFWETTDMDNNSCVTVTYDNFFPAGTSGPLESGPPVVSYWPNPAQSYLGIGWSHGVMNRIDMYSSDGRLVNSATSTAGFSGYEWDLTAMPEGIYYIHCNDAEGFVVTFTFVHTTE